jgi:hypothetical protein
VNNTVQRERCSRLKQHVSVTHRDIFATSRQDSVATMLPTAGLHHINFTWCALMVPDAHTVSTTRTYEE